MFKSVGLVARYDKKPALKLAEELAEYLTKKGLKVYIEDTLSRKNLHTRRNGSSLKNEN